MNDFNSLHILPVIRLFHHFGGEYASVQLLVQVEIIPLPHGCQREIGGDPGVRDVQP